MISYYKHSNGEAFTLENGEDYVGFFNSLSGITYTGSTKGVDSVELTPKSTFISDVYQNLLNFDSTYKHVNLPTPYYSNVFDLLNKQGLDEITNAVDINNINCYRNLVINHPTIYQFERNNGAYYGIPNLSADNTEYVQNNREYSSILPFSESSSFSFLDNITTGTFVVDSRENFKYLCSDKNVNYILGGNFSNDDPLTIIATIPNTPYYNETHLIYNDIENSKFLIVKDNVIEIFDSSNYAECDNLILVDKIKLLNTTTVEYIWNLTDVAFGDASVAWETRYLTNNPNNPKYIKFGYNQRTGLVDNVLHIINKYSSDLIQTVNLLDFGISEVLDLDIRQTDDCVIILHKKSSQLYVCFFDPSDVTNTLINKPIYSIDSSLEEQKIKFVDYDSNLFYTYNSLEYQTRNISAPEYPSGRLETSNLYYLRDYIWNTTDEFYNFIPITWDAGSYLSNNYNNLLVSNALKNDKMYMILHNIGRVYTMSQPMNDRFMNFIPLDLVKGFQDIGCSESSIGLHINSAISSILKDTLNIFNKSSSSYTFEERKTILNKIQDFILETNNLYINGNETINVVALQRIMILITDIQKKLTPIT